MNISRRRILWMAAAGAGEALVATAAQQEPHAKFPRAARERLAVTSWPFRGYFNSPTNQNRDPKMPAMDLTQFPAMVREKFGVVNVNPLSDHFSSTDAAYVERLRRAVEDAHSHVVDLGLSGKNFCSKDASVRSDALSFGRKWIDIAQMLGSPSVRQHLRVAPGSQSDPAEAARNLGELAAYGAQKHVVVLLENDSAISEDPFFIVDVVERVNNPYLRALPDFGNSLQGHDQAFNERAVTAMFKHAYNMSHVKDILRSRDGKEYRVDVARMFAIAKASGYRGYFSMEVDTKASQDPYEGTTRLINESLRYL
jgi:sugar phosphate isomerase/epimerase